MRSTPYRKLLELLVGNDVKFILIGGVAANLHGSARATYDVDVVYERSHENAMRLAAALKPVSPYLRGAPPSLPFVWDERTIRNGLNFTLTTTAGDLDLLGEVTGGGDYHALLPYAVKVDAFGVSFLCLGLERLIQIKRAVGRPRDLEVIAELQVILEERRKSSE